MSVLARNFPIMNNDHAGAAKRILLIDDHLAVREGLKLLLAQEDYVVCGEAGSLAETLEWIGSSRANLALLVISLGKENGLECIAKLRKRGIAVLVYSMHEDTETIGKALVAGANGYVSKREQPEVLLTAMADVLEGKYFIGPRTAGVWRDSRHAGIFLAHSRQRLDCAASTGRDKGQV